MLRKLALGAGFALAATLSSGPALAAQGERVRVTGTARAGRSGKAAAPAMMLRLVVVVMVGFLLSAEIHWWW